MSAFNTQAAAYVPKWMTQPAGAARPAPPAPPASKIVVTNTTTNASAVMPKAQPTPTMSSRPAFTVSHASSGTQPMPSPGLAAAYPPPSPGGSPSLSKRVPMRINSPAFTPKSRHMNPNAVEFVPGRSGDAHVLDELPTSTADMERGVKPQQQQAVSRSPAWRLSRDRMPSVTNSPVVGPVRLDEKSAGEIMAISQKSALKIEAPSYQPRRTLNRVTLAKPSPLLLASDPATASTEMMLDDLWSLFYLPSAFGESIKEEDYNPTLVFRVDSIPTFWKVFNNIPQPTEMPLSTLYLFRDGIAPKWEDPANRSGGIVKVKVSASQVDEAWELLLCRTIGDSWTPSIRDTVSGVALKVRDRAFLLEVWVTKEAPELMRDLTELWQTVLGGAFAATYISHEAMQTRSQSMAAAQAEKNKKQRRRF